MAEGIVIGAIVGTAYTELIKVAKDAASKVVWCKKYCKALAKDLDTYLPIFSEIVQHMDPACELWESRLVEFREKLEQGRLLVNSCMQISFWHPIQRLRYSNYILKLTKEILQYLQSLTAFNTLLLQQLHARQEDLLEQLSKLREEAINPLIATMNGNPTFLLDWVMRQANSTGPDEGQSSSGQGRRLDKLQGDDQLLVGVDNPIAQVKSLLLSGEGKMVTIVGGMGGIGKTTLAKAICRDPQVREFFEDRIHFFTVSQSPDMMGLLSTIWQEVVKESMPLFQNEEDAHRQLKDKLHVSMHIKSCLLVLDDVWSKANLENLLFEVNTLITTRQAPTLETHHSHTFTLGLLSEENAQSLFCYWAFGEESIPPWAEETLVKEVISECKCLPLALKVIGGSLSGSDDWFPIVWRNARDKLRQAEPLGDYHKDALQRRLQTSIDALDPKLQECFLDLGAYPEDVKCSADTLLDIWVYVRGMEWDDAVLALAELGSRCLLDFHKRFSGDDGLSIEYGSASTLIFSQHDVMRDLALYLGRKDHPPSQRARLLMPQKEKNIPKDWQSEAPLAAQIISISTGAMREEDWPSTLAFPFAEALLLYFDGDYYHLPPCVQSMCKLKVMSIRCSKRMCKTKVFLQGGRLSQLQSMDMENVALITSDITPQKLRVKVVKGADSVLSKLRSQNLTSLCVRDGWFKLPTSIDRQLRSLQLLNISGCSQLHKLPKQLGNLTNLVCLSLRNCHELRELPAASLCKLQRLQVLEIRRCSKVEKLPQTLGQLSALKELSLAFCEELRELPTTFGQLVALKKLYLQGCNGLQDLPPNFGLLRSLETLVLDDCSGLEELPQNFGRLSNLKQLTMNRCSKLKQLPDSFGELSELRRWDMVGVGLKSLPASLRMGLVRLESVECSESLMPLWKEARGDMAPYPRTKKCRMPSRTRRSY